MRRIAYITGTRADYGLMAETLHTIEKHPKLDLLLIATGMHLMKKFGHTLDEVKKDGFTVEVVDCILEGDDPAAMSSFFSNFAGELTALLKKVKPDILLILGDRPEMLAAAAVATYLRIPIAHLHGGERSMTVDEPVRHAIAKLAHIHLPATEGSAARLRSLGERKESIFPVGAPGLVGITKGLMTKEETLKRLGLQPEPYVVVCQHPESHEPEISQKQMKATLDALEEESLTTILLYPNADASAQSMIEVIKQHKGKNFHIHKHLNRKTFHSVVHHAEALIGNSSCGMIEAASLKVPVVNIGERQRSRERSSNVIDSAATKEEIRRSIKRALSRQFKERMKDLKNVYGDGNAHSRIAEILSTIPLNQELLKKHNTY